MNEAPEEARARVDRAIGSLQSAIGDIRGFVYDLRPALQAPEDLRRALEEVADELGWTGSRRVEVRVADGVLLSSEEAVELVKIVREALSNVGRHAGAAHAQVELISSQTGARLSVSDDGRGFDPAASRSGDHHGLDNMRDRAAALGGRFRVESSPASGTRVVVELPSPDDRETP
jgi:signal transduction histidine kinase